LVNLHLANKQLFFTTIFSKQDYKILIIFKKIGLVQKFFISLSNTDKIVKIFLFYLKKNSLFKRYKIVSTNSKKYFVSLEALRLINKRLGASLLILSTNKGLETHVSCLKQQKSGLIIGFLE
jgi:ribosomal protein S8